MVSVIVRYLFYQLMDEKIKTSKHGLFVFSPKKTLIWRRHCSITQSCCSMTSKRSIDWFLESSREWSFFHPSVRLTNQKPCAFVSVRLTNQIALFSFVCCFCFVSSFSFQGHTKIALKNLTCHFVHTALSTARRLDFPVVGVNRTPRCRNFKPVENSSPAVWT